MSKTREKPITTCMSHSLFHHSIPFVKEKKDAKMEVDEELVEVEHPFSINPYSADRYNDFFVGWLIQNKQFNIKHFIQINHQLVGAILSRASDSKTIAMFSVANYPTENLDIKYYTNHNQYPTLQTSLEAYKKKNIPCSQLIIPITELHRGHFRLLVIQPAKKEAIFYDSKSKFFGAVAEFALTSSPENYFYIEKTCEKIFPGMRVDHVYKAHQAWNNHIDCGPITAAYALRIAQDQSLDEPMCVTEARGDQARYINAVTSLSLKEKYTQLLARKRQVIIDTTTDIEVEDEYVMVDSIRPK